MNIDVFAFTFMRVVGVIFFVVGLYALVITAFYFARRKRVMGKVIAEEQAVGHNGTILNSYNYTVSFTYRFSTVTQNYREKFKRFSVGDNVPLVYCNFPKRIVIDRPLPGYAGLILLFMFSLIFINAKWFFANIESSPSSLVWLILGLGIFFLLQGIEKLFNAAWQRNKSVVIKAVISEILESEMADVDSSAGSNNSSTTVYMPIYDFTYDGVAWRCPHGYYTNLISYTVGEWVELYLDPETMYIQEVETNKRGRRQGVFMAVAGALILAAFAVIMIVL